jgi:hypothetical protein
MRRLSFLLFAAVLGLLLAGAPSAQAGPAKLKGTITLPGNDVNPVLIAGDIEGEATVAQLQQTCPSPGALDGVTYKFFDLKSGFTKFRALGPVPLVNQQVPETPATNPLTYNEYDLDIYAFDAKCVRIEAPDGSAATGTSTGGIENLKIRKPARYVVVSYYSGPYLNIPFELEYSN